MRLFVRSVLAVIVLLGGGACIAASENTAAYPLDPRIRWVYDAPAPIYYGSPALSTDGLTVYVGTSSALLGAVPRQESLIALEVATGAVRWTYPLGLAEVRSSPAVAPDGSITVLVEERNASGGFVGNDVVRVSPTGTLVWKRALGVAPERVDIGFSAPAIGTDGSVYVATDSLYAIRPEGTIRWTRFFTGEDLRASPTIGSDGTIYFVSHNLPLTAMHPDSGRVLWALPLGVQEHVFAAPAIGTDGSIYVAASDCKLFSVSSAGVLQWTYDATSGSSACAFRSSPAIGADGTIYLGSVDRTPRPVLFAVRPNGAPRWTFSPSDLPVDVAAEHFDIYSSPAIGSDGAVYFGHEFGRIYSIDAQTGGQRWMVRTKTVTGITWSSPVVTVNGILIINDLQGRVHALNTESAGLQSTAPWPRFRGSNRSAGRR